MSQNNEHATLGFLTPKVTTVLEFFMENPMQEYHERKVIRKTGVSLGSANKILRLLAKLGFLTREEKDRLAIYRLNLNEPTVRQFKILINTFALKPLIDDLKEVSRRIVLFGSRSQGTKESDIDLQVITDDKEQVAKIISEFNRMKERRVAPIIMNVNEYIRLKIEDKPLYENIERGIVLWKAE